MKKIFFYLLIVSFAIGCSKKNKVPEGILPKKKMQEVMWDMARAGEFLHSFVLYKDSTVDKAAESQKWYSKIYELHHITKAEFDRSYEYYKQHPVLMQELLDSLGRKQVSTRQYGQDSSRVDSSNKRTPPAFDEVRKRMTDTLRKRKILKKRAGVQ